MHCAGIHPRAHALTSDANSFDARHDGVCERAFGR